MKNAGGIYHNSWSCLKTTGRTNMSLLLSRLCSYVTAKQLNVILNPLLPQKNDSADISFPQETEPNSTDLFPPSIVTIEPFDKTICYFPYNLSFKLFDFSTKTNEWIAVKPGKSQVISSKGVLQ